MNGFPIRACLCSDGEGFFLLENEFGRDQRTLRDETKS